MLPAVSPTVTVWLVVEARTNTTIRFPAVLLPGNAWDTEETLVPCTAADCTSAIPPPLPDAIVMLKACVAVWDLASLTCTVKLLVPTTVGVPEITPVLLFKFSPLGSVPIVIDHA